MKTWPKAVRELASQMNGISSTADRAGSLIADAGGRRPNLQSSEVEMGQEDEASAATGAAT